MQEIDIYTCYKLNAILDELSGLLICLSLGYLKLSRIYVYVYYFSYIH